MEKITVYPYSQSDLLTQPQKYAMSPFYGPDFLVTYKKFRTNILLILNKLYNEEISLSQIKEIIFQNSHNVDEIKIQTENLFKQILEFLINKKDDKKFDFIINVFLKKFEVKKKFFLLYDSDFLPISEDYQNLQNYILFSLICQKKYEQTEKLKFLNASLKLNDLICSQIHKISKTNDCILIKYLIQQELNFIINLCSKKGLNI